MSRPTLDFRAPFSVVIPACNEEAVITRCLAALLVGAPDRARPEIVVVCNGCRDDTAKRARAFGVKVIELPNGSKSRAINVGSRVVTALPRFVVDADVVVDYAALAAAAAALAEPGVKAAAPFLRASLEGCSWPVRSYYRVWQALPYVEDALVGSGVYGLSAEGVRAIGDLPDIIADDGYVRARFEPAERRRVTADARGRPAEFVIFPPRAARDLIRIEARRRAGDAELRARGAAAPPSGALRGVGTALFRRFGPFDLAVYLAIKAAGRLRFAMERVRGRAGLWLRDESSRLGPAR
jgi:hypothetical protein